MYLNDKKSTHPAHFIHYYNNSERNRTTDSLGCLSVSTQASEARNSFRKSNGRSKRRKNQTGKKPNNLGPLCWLLTSQMQRKIVFRSKVNNKALGSLQLLYPFIYLWRPDGVQACLHWHRSRCHVVNISNMIYMCCMNDYLSITPG